VYFAASTYDLCNALCRKHTYVNGYDS